MKFLNNFADNFQKGGIPFLIFIGVIGYIIARMLSAILPDFETVEEKAKNEVINAIGKQPNITNGITTENKMVANRLHLLCDGFFKDEGAMMEQSKYFISATITKRVYVAYGVRPVSELWFEPKKMDLITAIFAKFGQSSEVGKTYSKIFERANLA